MSDKNLILFSGGDGVGEGMKLAGTHNENTFGIELNDKIAEVARLNGHQTRTANILDIDPAEYGNLHTLHMSPPCPNFSNAKQDAEETDLDIALSEKCAEFITVCQPEFMTLENVYQYRNSKSWAIIEKILFDNGYGWDYWHLNAADYGVPQTRQRMIAIARRDGKRPTRPNTTHCKYGKPAGLFEPALPKWIGWYEAIEDLLDTLPDSKFAPWQLERMPDEYKTMLGHCGNVSGFRFLDSDEPARTITARAWEKEGTPRALIADGQANSNEQLMTARESAEPVYTLSARAFIVEPVAGNIIDQQKPMGTLMASPKTADVRANIGRVVALTPRALARLQSFPDSYQLPEKKSLACTIIGNSVPPLLYKSISEVMA